MVIKTMLEFEEKWMNLTSMRTPGLKIRSELLDSRVFAKIVEWWELGDIKPEWLEWLLDKYELHSSVAVNNCLNQIRNRMETITVARDRQDGFALLQKENDYLLRRLEQLSFEPQLDLDAAVAEVHAEEEVFAPTSTSTPTSKNQKSKSASLLGQWQ